MLENHDRMDILSAAMILMSNMIFTQRREIEELSDRMGALESEMRPISLDD